MADNTASPIRQAHQYATPNRAVETTTTVRPGSSVPKSSKIFPNCGTMPIIRNAAMLSATPINTAG